MAMITPPRLREIQTLGHLNYEYNNLDIAAVRASDAASALLGVDDNDEWPTEYKLLKNALVDRFWWQEVGCDIDEIFIEKFQTRWSTYAPLYARNINLLNSDGLFNKITMGERNNTLGTGYRSSQTTDTQGSHDNTKTHTGNETENRTDKKTGTIDDVTSNESRAEESKQKNSDLTTTNFGANINKTSEESGDNTTSSQNSAADNLQTFNTQVAREGDVTRNATDTDTGSKNTLTAQETVRQNDGTDVLKYSEAVTKFDVELIRELPEVRTIVEDFINRFKSLFMIIYTEL